MDYDEILSKYYNHYNEIIIKKLKDSRYYYGIDYVKDHANLLSRIPGFCFVFLLPFCGTIDNDIQRTVVVCVSLGIIIWFYFSIERAYEIVKDFCFIRYEIPTIIKKMVITEDDYEEHKYYYDKIANDLIAFYQNNKSLWDKPQNYVSVKDLIVEKISPALKKFNLFFKKIFSYWKLVLIVIVSFLLIASIVYAFIGNKDFILNTKSHIFHEEWCFAIQNSKNVINFKGSRFEVIFKGYSPCSHCTP